MITPRQEDDAQIRAPYRPLTDCYAREEDRRGWVSRVLNGSAAAFDRIERLIGFGSGAWYRGEALRRAGLQSGMRALNVGTGVVPWLAKLSPRSADTPALWTYYWDTIEACASVEAVQQCLRGRGFSRVDRLLSLGVFSEYRATKTA